MDVNTEKVEISKEVFDQLSALPNIVSGLVEELKTERKDKQTAQAERDAALVAAAQNPEVVTPPAGQPEDPEVVVRRVLAEQAKGDAQAARDRATAKFKETHKEFHPDNDPGGLKYAAFERTLGKLNTSGAQTEEDHLALFGDALTLMNRPAASEEQIITPYADTPTDGGTPTAANPNGLTPKEKRVIAGLGWTEEKYLNMKKSRPAYVKQMIELAP